jgi:hypothetical protein
MMISRMSPLWQDVSRASMIWKKFVSPLHGVVGITVLLYKNSIDADSYAAILYLFKSCF